MPNNNVPVRIEYGSSTTPLGFSEFQSGETMNLQGTITLYNPKYEDQPLVPGNTQLKDVVPTQYLLDHVVSQDLPIVSSLANPGAVESVIMVDANGRLIRGGSLFPLFEKEAISGSNPIIRDPVPAEDDGYHEYIVNLKKNNGSSTSYTLRVTYESDIPRVRYTVSDIVTTGSVALVNNMMPTITADGTQMQITVVFSDGYGSGSLISTQRTK